MYSAPAMNNKWNAGNGTNSTKDNSNGFENSISKMYKNNKQQKVAMYVHVVSRAD